MSEELRQAQRRAVLHLQSRGAVVEHRKFPRLARSIEIWSSMLSAAGGTSFAEMLGNGQPVAAATELWRWCLGRSRHTLPALGLALLEQLVKGSPAQATHFVEQGAKLRAELLDALGPTGVMLYPAYPSTAPKHGVPLFPPVYLAYAAIFNVLELPATAVPLGLDSQGLPLGVQVTAAHGNDHITIAVELERAFGGWVPPHSLHAAAALTPPA